MTNIKNPTSAGTTGTFTITTTDTNNVEKDTLASITGLTVTGGAISSVTITPADTAAGATSTVTFAFTTASNIAATGKIVITFPSGYDLTGTPAAASTSDLDGTLAAAVSGQVVTITRSSGTAFTAGATQGTVSLYQEDTLAIGTLEVIPRISRDSTN